MTQSSDEVLFSLNNFVLQNTYDICATNMQVKCFTEFHINIVSYKLPTSNFTPHQSEGRSWANCVFKIPGCVRKSFVTFVPGRQVNAWYVGYGNCSKLHVCKVAVIIANYKIFEVNPLSKQSSNEQVRHDWNTIIANKILSHHWRVFWRKIIFASKFGGNQMYCTRYTLQYPEQTYCTTDNKFTVYYNN